MAKPAARRGRSAAIDGAIGALLARFGNKVVTSEAVREQHCHTTNWIPNSRPIRGVRFLTGASVYGSHLLAAPRPVHSLRHGNSRLGHVNAPFAGLHDVRDMTACALCTPRTSTA